MGKLTEGNLRRQQPALVTVPEGEIRMVESHHAADFVMAMDTWPFHKICWVAVGQGTLEWSQGKVALEANDFLLLPAGWAHRFVDDTKEPLTLMIVCISEKYISERPNGQLANLWTAALELAPLGQVRTAQTAFHHSSLIERFRLGLREQENQDLGWETALELVAQRLLLNFARGYTESSRGHASRGANSLQTVTGAIAYVDAHVYENLQINDMADRCQLSPRRFTDLFKQQTGETFSRYLTRKRIEYACRRLNETGHILYACHESGFNDVAYFYRVFKKTTGKTPGVYLRENQALAE
jgi:AraC-like DNA-binding protein/mannose-6-phosphate isomerase-like protein (cupin superfamily)